MFKIKLLTAVFLIAITLHSCHKKNYPAKNSSANVDDNSVVVKKNDSLLTTKTVVKRKPKVPTPKVIVVNDSAARKSVDGRLYYDVLGHRYWRNYKDGKYYLFNKSMFTDPAFKKPG